jgi:4-alpha-glucanotransferase
LAYRILKHQLASNAMWVILPWQDWLSMHADLRKNQAGTERINRPDNSKHHWNYRIHLNIEEFLNSTTLNKTIRQMLVDSGR